MLSRLSRGEELAAATQSTHGVTYANKVSPEEAQIDWSASAVEIDRKVRAFNPSPGGMDDLARRKLKVWATGLVPVPSCLGSEPGTVTAAEGERAARFVAHPYLQSPKSRAGGKRMAVGAPAARRWSSSRW